MLVSPPLAQAIPLRVLVSPPPWLMAQAIPSRVLAIVYGVASAPLPQTIPSRVLASPPLPVWI